MNKKKTKTLAMLLASALCVFSFTACATSGDTTLSSQDALPKFSSETPSSETPSSEASSSETPSSETPSSKVSSDEPQSSETPSSAKPSSKPASKPSASSKLSQEELDEIEWIEWQKAQNKRQKELETLTKAYINFTVTDKSGNAVQGVGTEFDTNHVPNTGGELYASNDKTGITNKRGETSVNLIQYNLMHTVDSVWIRWDRQFTATLTVPDGRVYTAKAVAEEGSDKYTIRFGERSSNSSLKITVADNNTYTFGVTIDDTVE